MTYQYYFSILEYFCRSYYGIDRIYKESDLLVFIYDPIIAHIIPGSNAAKYHANAVSFFFAAGCWSVEILVQLIKYKNTVLKMKLRQFCFFLFWY